MPLPPSPPVLYVLDLHTSDFSLSRSLLPTLPHADTLVLPPAFVRPPVVSLPDSLTISCQRIRPRRKLTRIRRLDLRATHSERLCTIASRGKPERSCSDLVHVIVVSTETDSLISDKYCAVIMCNAVCHPQNLITSVPSSSIRSTRSLWSLDSIGTL